MNKFTIPRNEYLLQDIRAFYHTAYVGFQKPGNPDYINILKNTYGSDSTTRLNSAVQELQNVLQNDLRQILQELQFESLTVCVVPRAKTNYLRNQLLFKSTVRSVVIPRYGPRPSLI